MRDDVTGKESGRKKRGQSRQNKTSVSELDSEELARRMYTRITSVRRMLSTRDLGCGSRLDKYNSNSGGYRDILRVLLTDALTGLSVHSAPISQTRQLNTVQSCRQRDRSLKIAGEILYIYSTENTLFTMTPALITVR